MNFAAPLQLAWLGLLAPLVVLYILRRKRERRVVGSTLLWESALRDLRAESPFRRLVPHLSLLLQVLVVVLGALALARPSGAARLPQGAHIAFVVDTSLSMGATPAGQSARQAPIERARRVIQQRAANLPPGSRALVIAVNKMDLVDYDSEVFNRIREEFESFASRLDLRDVTFLPISALAGDNVVSRSANMPWFEGPTLLHHLENVYTASDENRIDTRFPVQFVIRPQRADNPDYRGYAGRVAGGVLRVGDDVMVLPSGLTSTITGIDSPDGALTQAEPGQAVTILLADDLSITRGDMICRPNNRPRSSQELEAMLCWMDDAAPLQIDKIYSLKHTTKLARGKVSNVLYRLDISNLHRETGIKDLKFNEIGRVTLHTTSPLFFDDYHQNRTTGSFILIDEASGQTAAAGMLLSPRS